MLNYGPRFGIISAYSVNIHKLTKEAYKTLNMIRRNRARLPGSNLESVTELALLHTQNVIIMMECRSQNVLLYCLSAQCDVLPITDSKFFPQAMGQCSSIY